MKTNTSRVTSAFSLIEVTLALGVAGFCLIAIFGLLPVALNSNQAAIEQTAANAILTAVTSDLRATPATNPPGSTTTSQQYKISIPKNGSTATQPPLYFTGDRQKVASAALARYQVTVTFLSNSGARTATFSTIKVTWPAAATVANAIGSAQTFVALDRN